MIPDERQVANTHLIILITFTQLASHNALHQASGNPAARRQQTEQPPPHSDLESRKRHTRIKKSQQGLAAAALKR